MEEEQQTTTATPITEQQLVEQIVSGRSRIESELRKVVIGQKEVISEILIALFAGGHCLITGAPGLAKTLLVKSISQIFHLKFQRIQFTPDLMPADIAGTTIVTESEGGGGRRFVFQRGPIFAQIILADEINRATPKTQSALLEAMAERGVTVAGVTHPLDEPFFVLATQNPLEQEGTYPLPEAQLDRFFFKLLVGAPSRNELAEVLNRTTAGKAADVAPVIDGPRLIEHQALVRLIAIAPHVQDYAVRLTLGTHPGAEFSTSMVSKYVRFGASPRAAQALVLAGKCRAMMEGRAAASISDMQAVAKPALRHRLILNFEAQAEGVSADAVVENVVATLPQTVGL